MGPWWIRNHRIYDRFVPTALWLGASLYDGLSPTATGASDMAFLGDRDIWPLGEQDQDAELTRRTIAFALSEPGRALELALVKFGRFWSPWPNAEGFRSPYLAIAGAAIELPIFALLLLGAWDRRRDLRASRCWEGRCCISARCTWRLRARCAIASPARYQHLGWRRLAGCARSAGGKVTSLFEQRRQSKANGRSPRRNR